MPDDKPLLRQWCLLRMLSSRRYGPTLGEMAPELGVTEKTIRRYLDDFQAVGFPVECTAGDRGRNTRTLGNGGFLPPMTFTFDEAVVLYLGRRFLEPMAATQLWEASAQAMRKIRATLSKLAPEYLERFPQLFRCIGAGNHADESGRNRAPPVRCGVPYQK